MAANVIEPASGCRFLSPRGERLHGLGWRVDDQIVDLELWVLTGYCIMTEGILAFLDQQFDAGQAPAFSVRALPISR